LWWLSSFVFQHNLRSVVDFHGHTKWSADGTSWEGDGAVLVLLVQTSPSRIEHRRVWRKRRAAFNQANVRVVFCVGRDGDAKMDAQVLR
jgi:hypothetical protein